MDLIYDIEEKVNVKDGHIAFDLDLIEKVINNFKLKGLERQENIELVPLEKVIAVSLLFVSGVPLFLYFIIQTYFKNMYLLTLGIFFICLSFIPIALDYYRNLKSKNLLIQKLGFS